MGKGGEWFEMGDDKEMKLPRPLVETMFPPAPGDVQMMKLDKWYPCVTKMCYMHMRTWICMYCIYLY